MTHIPQELENGVDRLAELAVELGCAASAADLSGLAEHARLIQRWNRRKRIVGTRDPRELLEVHLADGLALAGQLQSMARPGQSLIDVGSGAGLPGMVVALLMPGLDTHLCEVSEKRAAFLHHARRELDASVHILHEDVSRLVERGQTFDHAVSRAVFEPERWLEVGSSLVCEGGSLWLMLTRRQHGELALQHPGGELHTYRVGGDRERVLLRFHVKRSG